MDGAGVYFYYLLAYSKSICLMSLGGGAKKELDLP